MTDFCTYHNDICEVMDFGKDFAGNRIIVCVDRTSDVLMDTMQKVHDII